MASVTWLNTLNARQYEAVTAPLKPLLVLAGAGSGKTRVLVSRMAYLTLHYGLAPESILAVTFTNKAALEMKTRLNVLLPQPMHRLWVGTFHGLCHRMLRQHYLEANLPQHFQILDSDDQARLIKRVLLALHLDPEQWPIKQAQHFINARKDEGLRPQHVVAPNYGPAKTWVSIYKAYEAQCAAMGVIDFAEILLRCYELLKQNQSLLSHYHQQFQAVLIDEFQDTNPIQYAWMRLLAHPGASVMVVGDDDQSIYGWRGAKIENIQRFCDDFQSADMLRLEQNYRSTSVILEAANALIEHNTTRMGKALWTEGERGEKIRLYSAINELDEARFVKERIMLALDEGRRFSDIAVLYRSNAQSRVIEEALLQAGIPYTIYGGMRFFERAEIKDAIAYLRLIVNTEDDSAFERIVNFPPRGIGEKTLETIREKAKSSSCSLWQATETLVVDNSFSARTHNALVQFIRCVGALKSSLTYQDLDKQIAYVLEESGLMSHYAKTTVERSQSKLENLQELISAARQFAYESDIVDTDITSVLTLFLSTASLESGERESQAEGESVQLMTLHSAKGMEFPYVFLVGMEEGLFPSRQSLDEPGRLEEERRLCYVGLTRAKERLVISHAEVRRLYGREEYHRPSRFLREIPETLFESPQVIRRERSQGFEADDEGGYRIGQKVMHTKFGQGIVMAISGEGANSRVQVKFREGLKWLVVAYANLLSVP